MIFRKRLTDDSMSQFPDMDTLKALDIKELQTNWRAAGGSGVPPTTKWLLVREIAWRIQSKAQGGLDSDTHRRLREAVRNVRVESSKAHEGQKRATGACPPVRLPSGAKLVRTWRGQRHEVTILEHGKLFQYRGESFRSLTKIAEKITSAHWSGPRFFGLHKVRGVS